MNWNNTGHRAQDFVSQLLVLDETKRMDVKQALKHSWFTNPAHKHEFEALYNRSVRDWRPRERKSPLIVDLETFTGVRDDVDGEDQSLERVSLSGSSVEHYDVPSQVENQSSGLSRQWAARQRETLSPTLSDPALPALTRVGNRQADRNQDILPPRADSMDCEVNTVELLSRVRFLSSSEPSLHSIRYGGSQLDEREEGISNGQIPHTLGSIEGSMEMDIQFPSTRKIRKSIWDDFDGEVYEELNNIVTGESQHFAYGARAMRY